MATHKCEHEVDIALMGQEIKILLGQTKDIHEILVGNGKPGIKTDVEVTKSSVKRIWYFIGTFFTGFVGLAFWVLKSTI